MSIYDTHKPAAGDGGGLYLKISDGETVKLRIASEPAIYETESERDDPDNPGQKKTVISTRYAWTVFNQDTKTAQILQQSATFFRNLAALAQDEEWGDPTGYDIKITRKGMELDTKYNIVPSANRESLDDNARELVSNVDLLDKLKASQFNQRVMWLSDYDKQASGETKKEVETSSEGKSLLSKTTKSASKPDTVITDIGDEPVNLDDIPF